MCKRCHVNLPPHRSYRGPSGHHCEQKHRRDLEAPEEDARRQKVAWGRALVAAQGRTRDPVDDKEASSEEDGSKLDAAYADERRRREEEEQGVADAGFHRGWCESVRAGVRVLYSDRPTLPPPTIVVPLLGGARGATGPRWGSLA